MAPKYGRFSTNQVEVLLSTAAGTDKADLSSLFGCIEADGNKVTRAGIIFKLGTESENTQKNRPET